MAVLLTETECRVLGSLLEKEVTVPATYPLTLNAVVTACNQSSGRDPVLSLEPRQVAAALDELRTAHLVRLVHASHGARTVKYRQVAHEQLALAPDQRAVITLLLLRGPQTPGELRSRADRLHAFADVGAVEAALTTLAEGRDDGPLVVRLPRQPGRKEDRWAHLLGGEPTVAADPAPTEPQGRAAPVAVPAEVAVLTPFIGTWTGPGHGSYPTIEPFPYTEEIELRAVPGKPFLAYRSSTRHGDDGRPLHGESGFLRVVGGGSAVELVVAQGPGIVEIAEGEVERTPHGGELLLASTAVAASSTAKAVTATERHYQVVGDVLTYELAMAVAGQPLTAHLTARLTRART